MMGWEITRHNTQKTLTRQYIVEHQLFTLVTAWLTGSYCSLLFSSMARAATESLLSCIASSRKDQNSQFEVQILLNAYHFHTVVKLKNSKPNHCKLGTVCIWHPAKGKAIQIVSISSLNGNNVVLCGKLFPNLHFPFCKINIRITCKAMG